MIRHARRLIGVATLALLSIPGAADAARLCSWNIQNLGWGEQKSYGSVAHVANHCDFIAVQEVMNEQGLELLERHLQKLDSAWTQIASHAIGRGRYREIYAFFYRTGTVDYVEGAVVFLDRDDRFAREPFSARFRTDAGTEFAAATVHVLYGGSVAERLPEIHVLASYWQWLEEVHPGVERLLLGDFNLPPTHEAYAPLRRLARPLVTSGATTLSSIDKRFANLYDNIWIARDSRLVVNEAGILEFPQLLRTRAGNPVTHKWARRHVSDHAPVFVTIDGTEMARVPIHNPGPPDAKAKGKSSKAAQSADSPVRGNRNSGIYHLPHCPHYDRVADHNRVPFRSESEARDAGYRKAGNC